VMAFREIENLMPIKEPADKTRIFRTLLKGQALSYFEHHLMKRLEAEGSDVPDNELIELVLRDVGLEYIPKRTIRVQKYYMRHPRGLYMGLTTFIQHFVERLNDLSCYLLYFPEENPKQLDQDEIIEILDQAKARDLEWHKVLVNANIDIFEMSYKESVSYFKRLENLEKIRRANGSNPFSLPEDNKKSVTSSVGKPSKNNKGSNMWCHYCDQHPSRICFITPGWHVSRNLNLLSLTMGVWKDSNVISNKCVTVMTLKPNQVQVTTNRQQVNAIIERVHKVVNDILRSFDLENNH
jgi:hypothetical protein